MKLFFLRSQVLVWGSSHLGWQCKQNRVVCHSSPFFLLQESHPVCRKLWSIWSSLLSSVSSAIFRGYSTISLLNYYSSPPTLLPDSRNHIFQSVVSYWTAQDVWYLPLLVWISSLSASIPEPLISYLKNPFQVFMQHSPQYHNAPMSWTLITFPVSLSLMLLGLYILSSHCWETCPSFWSSEVLKTSS